MNRKYIIPVVILVGLALVLVLLPEKKSYEEITPEELLRHVTSTSRFISCDEVTDRMIRKDPSLLLIDVRDEEQNANYSLPGALNIPLLSISDPEKAELLSAEGFDYVFFSNGDIRADQAWIISKRKNMDHIYVMKGGLNEWFASFFMMQPPPETSSAADIALYQFRSGVRQHFTGGGTESSPESATEKIIVTPKKKKSAAEGGC